jgi:hypothetical protein
MCVREKQCLTAHHGRCCILGTWKRMLDSRTPVNFLISLFHHHLVLFTQYLIVENELFYLQVFDYTCMLTNSQLMEKFIHYEKESGKEICQVDILYNWNVVVGTVLHLTVCICIIYANVTDNGCCYVWGLNDCGQIGIGSSQVYVSKAQQITKIKEPVVQVYAGWRSSCKL